MPLVLNWLTKDEIRMEDGQKYQSRGFYWSIPMFFLILVETLALTEVVLVDLREQGFDPMSNFVSLYYLIVVATLILQAGGMLLVWGGKYRVGGVLQIMGSSVHALKGEGIIGIIGGVKAYRSRYGENFDEQAVIPGAGSAVASGE